VTERGLVGVRYDRYDADRDANKQLGTAIVGTHRVFSTWAVLAAVQRGSARFPRRVRPREEPARPRRHRPAATIGDDRVIFRAQAVF